MSQMTCNNGRVEYPDSTNMLGPWPDIIMYARLGLHA